MYVCMVYIFCTFPETLTHLSMTLTSKKQIVLERVTTLDFYKDIEAFQLISTLEIFACIIK